MTGPEFDVAIIGGGPAGAAAAITLARGGARVAVLHQSRAASTFVETLPPGARPLLDRLGMWPSEITATQAPAYANESRWGDARVARTDFTRDPNGHGWHVDRNALDAAWRALARRAGAEVIEGATVRGVERDQGRWRISLTSGTAGATPRARRLIDATGRGGLLGRRFGVHRHRDDALVGVVAALVPCDGAMVDPDRLTFVESREDGWWFTAVTPRGRRVLAYFSDASDRSARRAASPAGFRELWQATAELKERARPEDWNFETPPRVRPAGSSRLARVGGDDWLAVGDAVMSFDPISSQGIMTAAYTGLRAGEAILSESDWNMVLDRYRERSDQVYAAYLAARRACYALERRWNDRPFWRSRRGSDRDEDAISPHRSRPGPTTAQSDNG